ncbi:MULTISPECIES: FadR/GntR family transcriptional regulator [Stappiaceae]|uniref:FadR/GntR family transcriptional regulator n=1 Tax=Stappiaceae TaxID=2821832 RepID=UPI0012680D9A|nr:MULTISPECIES: FCD domain-containing protein [Stappiaceae]QFT66461.1 Putative L-lactate dehydrogenase operon regulatory protein [Labrenzia sp. THAF35]UES38176.1 GntR family transcriptional regulator [Roseibium aggregatum]
MAIEFNTIQKEGLSVQIANAIRNAILEGRLAGEERLPSEADLAERFGVSRSTVREALKRLAAQNLIRSERGSSGGAFVNRMTWAEAQDNLMTTTRLLIGMNDIPLEDAIEARFALEAAALPLAAEKRTDDQLAELAREISRQRNRDTSDEDFCASDVAFHSAVARATDNPILVFQLSAAFEAMQPLMNMLVYRLRDRERIADLHQALADALAARDSAAAAQHLDALSAYTRELAAQRRKPRSA